jgi:hypothetical protein
VDGNYGMATGGPAGVNPDATNEGLPTFSGAAHTNANAGETATTLYAINQNGGLWMLNPPNSGTGPYLRQTSNPGSPASGEWLIGLDIPSSVSVAASNTEVTAGYGYVVASEPGGNGSVKVARLDLVTGLMTYTGSLPDADSISSLTLLPTAPVVTGPTLANLTYQSATIGGNVTDGGGSAITERGVLLSSTDAVTGTSFLTKLAASGTTGVFTVPLTALPEQTTYTYRAFATNALGTTYTTAASFTTPKEIDFNGLDDRAITTRGETRIYPLANDVSPSGAPLHLLSVSDPKIVIDGTSLIIPAGYTGTFTYKFSDGTKRGQASVTVDGVQAGTQAQFYSGLLRDAAGAIAGSAEVAFTPTSRAATVVLKVENAMVRTVVIPVPGSGGATRETALGSLSLVFEQDGTITARLGLPVVPLSGVLSVRHTAGPRARYHVALASIHGRVILGGDVDFPIIDPGIPGGGFAVATVLPNATVIVVAMLPDGTVFTTGSSLRENNTMAVFSPIRYTLNPPALCGGELVLADLATTDLTGEFEWVKQPQQTARYGPHYRGVDTTLTANGSRYAGQIPLNGGGHLRISGSHLAMATFMPIESHFVQIVAGRPALAGGSVKSWVVYPSLGIFLAGVEIAPNRALVLGRGVYLPKSKSAWGYFPGTQIGGRLVLDVP